MTGATTLEDILGVPLVRCDQVQWSWLGVSMAGWNAILSLVGAALIAWLATRKAA
jgi:disulfide bond formation protein DsbB